MDNLSNTECEACNIGARRLSSDEIESRLAQVDGWDLIEESGVKKLRRVFATTSYDQSIAFTNAVAELAKSFNHHPQIVVEYSSVTVVWWSHKIKGLHGTDFILAAKTSELA